MAVGKEVAARAGSYEATYNDPQGKAVKGKKQGDGHWKVVADTYNSGVPLAPR